MIPSTSSSISKIRKVRICPEHACRILAQERLWERGQSKEFQLRTESRPIDPPRPDHGGQMLAATEEHFLLNDKYPVKHERHIVLRAHCYRTIDGKIGASGKIDPKEMVIGDINYRQLAFENPACELCENGHMIHPLRRFRSSRYRPGEKSWHRELLRIWRAFRAMIKP